MDASNCRLLVLRFYDQLWNAWDDSAVDALLASDFQFRGSLGQHTRGRTEWRAYRDQIHAGAPDFHNEIVEVVDGGDRVAVRLRYSGTHRGPLLGLVATGRPFTYAGAAFFSAVRGQLTHAWVLGDLQNLRKQLS